VAVDGERVMMTQRRQSKARWGEREGAVQAKWYLVFSMTPRGEQGTSGARGAAVNAGQTWCGDAWYGGDLSRAQCSGAGTVRRGGPGPDKTQWLALFMWATLL
jgi:hypothetical protein